MYNKFGNIILWVKICHVFPNKNLFFLMSVDSAKSFSTSSLNKIVRFFSCFFNFFSPCVRTNVEGNLNLKVL